MLRRALTAIAALATTAALAALGLGVWLVWRVDRAVEDIPRIDLAPALRQPATSTPHGEEQLPPTTILLVGADSTSGLAGDDPRRAGREPGSRLADVIMLLHLDPPNAPRLTSIPRDLWVTLAHSGAKGKVNWALAQGGPESLVATVATEFATPIDHYVEVDFAGFLAVVGEVGGVPLNLSHPVQDPATGLRLDAGCSTLDGDTSLALVRSRSLSYEVDGVWVADQSGDLGRVERQQEFMSAAAVAATRNLNWSTPLAVASLVEEAKDFVVLSSSLDRAAAGRLARQVPQLASLTTETVPATPGWVGDQWVLFRTVAAPENPVPEVPSATLPAPGLSVTGCSP